MHSGEHLSLRPAEEAKCDRRNNDLSFLYFSFIHSTKSLQSKDACLLKH